VASINDAVGSCMGGTIFKNVRRGKGTACRQRAAWHERALVASGRPVLVGRNAPAAWGQAEGGRMTTSVTPGSGHVGVKPFCTMPARVRRVPHVEECAGCIGGPGASSSI
jgi:hypothetical protein